MSPASARVVLQRQPSPRQDILTTYQVLIDGTVVGGIRRKQTRSFDVLPGHHEIHLEWKKYRSTQLRLDLVPGQEVRLVCRPRPAKEWPRKMPNAYMILEFAPPTPAPRGMMPSS
jgi:hypothetical protein